MLSGKFAKSLKGGEVIGLTGDLGAGKTVFVKGLAKGLGIKKNIQSPTFLLMKVYRIKNHELRIMNHETAHFISGLFFVKGNDRIRQNVLLSSRGAPLAPGLTRGTWQSHECWVGKKLIFC